MLSTTIDHLPERIARPATPATLARLTTTGMPASTLTFFWGPDDDEVTIAEDVHYHMLWDRLVIQDGTGHTVEVDRFEVEQIHATRTVTR